MTVTNRKKNPVKILKHKFYVGQKLATRFIGDHDLILRGHVVSRTPKFVTVKVGGERDLKRCGIRVWENTEIIYPMGRYSMAPSFRAKDGDRVGNPASRKKNPDPITAFAQGASGLLSALQIHSMLTKRKTTKRKKANPVGSRQSAVGSKRAARKSAAPHSALRTPHSKRGIVYAVMVRRGDDSAKLVLRDRRGDGFGKKKNPSARSVVARRPARRSVNVHGEFYLMPFDAGRGHLDVIIGQGGENLHTFGSVAGAVAWAKNHNIKLERESVDTARRFAAQRKLNPATRIPRKRNVEGFLDGAGVFHRLQVTGKRSQVTKTPVTRNPSPVTKRPAAAKTNGILSRALARRRAAAELKRELRAEVKLERIRSRKAKAVKAARKNPLFVYARKEPTTDHLGPASKKDTVFYKNSDGTGLYARKPWHQSGHPTRASKSVTLNGHRWTLKWLPSRNPATKKKNPAVKAARKNPPGYVLTAKKGANTFSHGYAAIHETISTYAAAMRRQKALRKQGFTVSVRHAEIKNPAKAQKPKTKNPATTVRRPTYEMFQGRRVEKVNPMPVSRHAGPRPKMDQLGKLVELKLTDGRVLKINPARFRLCAKNGRMWIVGGKFAKPDAKQGARVLNPIEHVDHVVYETYKPHHGDAPGTHYIHKLGEEGGLLPLLCVDNEGFPVLKGGSYKIRREGIRD